MSHAEIEQQGYDIEVSPSGDSKQSHKQYIRHGVGAFDQTDQPKLLAYMIEIPLNARHYFSSLD